MDQSTSPSAPSAVNETNGRRRAKVERVIETYDLGDLGEELEDRWTGRTEAERRSLRELADYFNEQLLRSVVDAANVTTLDGEVENVYAHLTDDEVSEGTRIQTRMRLEREGVDVDEVLDDFVSHQAIHTYLTEYRDVEYASASSGNRVRTEAELEKVQRLQSRTVAVVEDTVERLRTADRVDVGDFDVLLDVRVLCEDCGTYYELTEILDGGSCQCEG